MGHFEDMSMFNSRQAAVVTAFSRVGYKVVPRKGVPCINRDTKTVYLPVVDPNKYPNVIRTIRGWTDHEMAHEIYQSDMKVLKKAIDQGTKFEAIFRYIEDGRVERLESADFEGCRENLVYLEKETLADRKKMGLTLYLAGKYGVKGVQLYKMDEWGAILGEDIIEKCHGINTCEQAYDVAQEAYVRIQKYIKAAVSSEMKSEAGTEEEEAHPTVSKEGPEKKEKGTPKEQDEILQDDDKPESKDSKKDEGSEKSDSKEEKDETEESESKGENEEANDNSGTDDDSGKPDVDEEEKKSRIESKLDEMISDKDLMDALVEKLQQDLEKIPFDPDSYTPYTTMDKEHDLTKDYRSFRDMGWFPRLFQEARGKVSALAQKLRLEFFATKMLFDRYKDQGRLDQRRLHVLGMGTSTDVFMKRNEQPQLDTAISLLIDSSGSMNDKKIVLAAQVAYLLSSTLESLNIPNEVLSFTSGGTFKYPEGYYDRVIPLIHFIHKPYASRLNHCLEAMNRIGCYMEQNTDGESVLWAAARLAKRKEKRRILFVLSDGQPNDGTTDEYKLYAHLKSIVGMVSKHGIECVGIGIMTESVKSYYPHSVVINDVNDLVTTAYGEIVKAIRGAKKGVQ